MTRDSKIVAIAIAAIGSGIAGAAILCTAAIAAGAAGEWRLAFRIFCHGMPERSLWLFGEAMPICARCFGIYAGLVIAALVFALRPAIDEMGARMFVFAAALPMAIDGLTQAAGLRVSTNPLRLATGIVAAIAFGLWALAAVQNAHKTAVRTS